MNFNSQKNGGIFARTSLLGLTLCVLLCTLPSAAKAAQNPASLSPDSIPTDSLTKAFEAQQSALQLPGTISGRIMDQSGAPVGGAHVALAREGQTQEREVITDGRAWGNGFVLPVGQPGLLHLVRKTA